MNIGGRTRNYRKIPRNICSTTRMRVSELPDGHPQHDQNGTCILCLATLCVTRKNDAENSPVGVCSRSPDTTDLSPTVGPALRAQAFFQMTAYFFLACSSIAAPLTKLTLSLRFYSSRAQLTAVLDRFKKQTYAEAHPQ